MSSVNDEDEKEQIGGYTPPFDPSWLQRPPSENTMRECLMSPNKCRTLLQSTSEETAKGQAHSQVTEVYPQALELHPLPTEVNPLIPKVHPQATDVHPQATEEHHQLTEDKEDPKKTHTVLTCIECVIPVYVMRKSDIQRGDHIAFVGRIYDHHAIVVDVLPSTEDLSESEVCIEIVHVTNTTSGTIIALINPLAKLAKINKNFEKIDFKKNKIKIFKYSNTITSFIPDKIVERAIEQAFSDQKGEIQKGEFEKSSFKYYLLDNNCEHFATWCVTGRKLSLQVWKMGMVFEMFVKSAFLGISDERIRNRKARERGMICDGCFARNEMLLNVEKKKIKNKNDVNVGDIITFSYYNFWHSAVVLEIVESTDKYVKCNIAHYNYGVVSPTTKVIMCYNFGGWRHNTIVEEPRRILLNGSTLVIKYDPRSFSVYEPDEVVARARSRLHEQKFAYFLNDSFHFTRWCKLKLVKRQCK